MYCRASDMGAAAEHAVFHAERAGDRGALLEAAVHWMDAPSLGMAPPEEAIRRCREVRARLPDDRLIEAFAEIKQGSAAAQLGRFDEGRRRMRRGEEILVDLGDTLWLGGLPTDFHSLEVLAGDLEAAERSLRRGMELLESIGEYGFRSTEALSLASVLYKQGRFAEAAEMLDFGEGLGASDDLVNLVFGRGIRAKLLARERQIEKAVRMAEEAVAMTDGIDFWDAQLAAFENLGEVYRLAGRRDDAIEALGRALDIGERKGVIPAVEQLRGKLDALSR